ncbi:ferredoxin [Kitasatospora sp. NBC_01287]|uniref:ferredoxin n=1 Tax=Kitasatospora sp. NBC_01287 TaxID=2903573 RepID=UPI002257E6CF|nr:ferredoxin [Kitasatospora sp. NBC_01287]MCX4745044.1 ferredoxin [Kitasatospora sp. NBC_01287]
MWIDQSKCQNSGLCEEEAPELFAIGEDFLAYVRQDGEILHGPGGAADQVDVPEQLRTLARDTAMACPAACIHLVD